MDAKKPSTRSQTKSSAARSKAGSTEAPAAPARPRARAAAGSARAATPVDPLALLDRVHAGRFPASVYVDGDDEALKAEFLSGLRRAWGKAVPEAPLPRVLRFGEDDVDTVLSAYLGLSMFASRELTIVHAAENLTRSEKRVAELAEGITRPAGESCLVLVEAAADAPRKTLAPVRAACAALVTIGVPDARRLLQWGQRRFAAEGLEAEPGTLEALLRACENESVSFLSELGKLVSCCAGRGRVTVADVAALEHPVVGAGLADYLLAVAAGEPGLAAQRLGRLLAAGESEGSVLWALGNLVSGAIGGWSANREFSAALGRRMRPPQLSAALDTVYRAEAAWKGGRVDALVALEQATREIATR